MKRNHKANVFMYLTVGALAMVMAAAAQAQTITWTSPGGGGGGYVITGDTDVSTTGASVFAYDWNYSQQAVNGVTFTAPGSYVTLSADMTGNYRGYLIGNNASPTPASKLSLNYQLTLTGGQSTGANPGWVILNNLLIGHNYQVQLWVDDSRSGEDTRNESVGDLIGDQVVLNYNSQVQQGGTGQYTIGTFTCDAISNIIVLSSSTSSQINAIQVRDLGLSSVAQPPVFSLPAGSYIGAQTVTIYGEPGATVFYTTDGSPPTTASPTLNGGIGSGHATVTIPTSSTVTLNAIETNTAQTGVSAVASAAYATFSTPAVPTWVNANGGSWTIAGDWANNVIGQGAGVTADFSQVTLPGSPTMVTCDGSITIGNLIFGDLGNANTWELDPGNDSVFNIAGSLTLAGPSPTITVKNQSALITVAMAGANGLTVAGPGTLILTNQNSYTGGTTVNGGATLLTISPNTATGAVGSGDVTVLGGGTVQVGGDNSFVGSSTADILSVSIANGGLIANTNALDTTYTTNLSYMTNYVTNETVITTNITTNIVSIITNLLGSSCRLNALVLDGGTLYAINTNGSGTWLLDFGVYTLGDGRTSFLTGGNVALTQSGGTAFSIIGNDTLVLSTLLAHTGSADNGFVKTGTGTLTLNDTTNTTLGNEAVNGGTLNGSGETRATLTVNAGGTLAPGSPTAIGQLGFTNLIVKAGGTVLLKINPAANTNDSVVGDSGSPLNAATYGGTLTVTNIGGTVANGDSFQLFYAKKYNGAFATYNLPPLSGGLHWNVGQLTVDGKLAVVSGPSEPTFNPTAGGFMTPQAITISDLTPGATIYYTTDGSTPTSSSTVYTSPINVPLPTNMTINAIAYAAGVPSAVSSGTFVTSTTAVWSNALATPSVPASWSVGGNWSNGIMANLVGGTADFSQLALPSYTNGAVTVTLDGNWTIGNMIFGDKAKTNAYQITPGTGTTALTLAGPSPTITLLNANTNVNVTNTALQTTITPVIAGSNGWTIVGTPINSAYLNLNNPELRLTAEDTITGGAVINGAAVYDNAGETSFGIFGRGNLLLTNGASIICNGSYWSMTGADPSLVYSVTIGPGCTITNAGGQAQILPNTIMDGGILSAGNGNANGGYGAWGFTGNVSTMGDGRTSYILGGGPNNGDLSFLSEGATVFTVGSNDLLVITAPFDFGWKNQDNGWVKAGAGTMEMDAAIPSQATNIGTISAGLFRGITTLNGPVFVDPGGMIGAGTSNAVGTLTLKKSLTLSPGSTTLLRVVASNYMSDQISLTGGQSLYFGGTLIVSNMGGSFMQGQAFILFSTPQYIGSFNSIILPALPTGLSWDTSQLESAGYIFVLAGCVPPAFSLPPGGYSGGAQQVTISTLTPGATLYYTIDGSTPTTSSPHGITPVTVTVPAGVTMTIQAYATEAGYSPDSSVSSATYTTVTGPAIWGNASGGTNSWSVAANWSNSIVANQSGGAADFSQLTLASNSVVTLDGSWSVGNLVFGDLASKYNWDVENGTNALGGLGGPLTLDNGPSNTPTITVNNGTTTIGTGIISLNGLNKTGPGTLLFTGTNVWQHLRGAVTTSGGPLIFSNNSTQLVPPSGITGTGPLTIVGQGINFLGNVTTGGNQSYTTGNAIAYEINGGYVSTNCILKATNGASITMVSPTLGFKNSNGGSLTMDTTDGNGTINLNIGQGGALYFPLEYIIANSGTGSINYYGTVNYNPLYAGVGDRQPPIIMLNGQINFTANMSWNVAGVMYAYPSLPSTFGGTISGAMTMWIGGPSTMTFTGTNTYTGTTTVTNGGLLLVNGRTTGGAFIVASGATLGGTGEVGGPTTILSGGTLEAGSPSTLGNFSLGDSLTMNSGSSTVMRINAATGANDAIAGPPVIPVVINYAGTLVVNNIAGTLALGNSFKLFNASSYNGTFDTLDLPALGSGLGWNWTPNTGTLSVVTATTTQPTFLGVPTLIGTSFSMSFTGPNGQAYSVLMTTDLTVPVANWTVVGTGTFGVSAVHFTDTGATGKARFYCIVTP